MANILGAYNPTFFAQEALIQLEAVLGMANTVHRGYDEERRTFDRGQTINIRRPASFVAATEPNSTAQDVNTETVTANLNHWWGVKFKVRDDELAYTGQRIIDEHIRPAAVAIATKIDSDLNELHAEVPWHVNSGANPSVPTTDIPAAYKVLFDNKVPVTDMDRMWLEIGGGLQADWQGNQAFSQQQGAGDLGVNTQVTGNLGRKFGMQVYGNQNVQSHTPGTAITGTPLTDGAVTFGATSITVDGITAGDLKRGDTLVIAGSTQRYAVTADVAAASSMTISISPPIQEASVADNSAVTFDQESTKTVQNLAYHRNAFAFVMARLPTKGDGEGARISSIQDPSTGLALRATMWYDADAAENMVKLDALYDVITLDPNLACRLRHNV